MTKNLTHSHGVFPESLQEALDAHLAQEPIPYRDYLIKPTSHRTQPFFLNGVYVYGGWIIVQNGCNVGPGGTWSRTIGGAKDIIDCMHEAGPRPALLWGNESYEEKKANGVAHGEWARRFWKLMDERQEASEIDLEEKRAVWDKHHAGRTRALEVLVAHYLDANNFTGTDAVLVRECERLHPPI